MEATQNQDDAPATGEPDYARHEAIAQLIGVIRASRSAGEAAEDQAVLDAHPELSPELGQELEKWRRVEAARRAAQTLPAESDDGRAAETLSAAIGIPLIQVPGYSVLREISRGGQAVVYLAHQLSTGRKVAIKVMREGPLADERALTRFSREVQVLAALNHPNIVAIIDTGRSADGSRYIVMNYVAGCGLSEYMQRRHQKDPDDPSKLLRLFLKICGAVNAAHRQGIVHRDLKPGNIRVDERGEPQVLDFGLARTALDRLIRGSAEPLSITGEFLGSLPWSSPEQAEGDPDKIDARTDVYSLGVILYQMLTGGRFPYVVVGNIRDVLNNILTAEPTPPSKIIAADLARETHAARLPATERAAAINETIERIVLKSLAKKREQRYRSAGELGRDVASYLLGHDFAAGKSKADSTGSPPPRPRPSRALALSVALASLVVAIAVISFGARYLWRAPRTGAGVPPVIAPIAAQATAATRPAAPLRQNPIAQPSTVVDLLAMIDPEKDVVRGVGHWRKRDSDLDYDGLWNDFSYFGAVRASYEPPAEYDLRVAFTSHKPRRSLRFLLLRAGTPFQVSIGEGDNHPCAIEGWADKAAVGSTAAIEADLPHQILIQVRAAKVTMHLDDRLVCQCRTDVPYLGGPPLWYYMGDNVIGVYTDDAIRIQTMQLVEVSGHGRPVSAAPLGQPPSLPRSPPHDQPSRIVDLMPLIDPATDAVEGTWERAGGMLRSDTSRFARLAIRYHPPEEYDFCVSFARTGDWQDVNLLLSRGDRSFMYLMGANHNTICAFSAIAGFNQMNNPTSVRAPATLRNGRAYAAIVYVRRGSIAASIGGKLIAEYKTDFSDFSLPAAWSIKEGLLGLATYYSPTTFYSIEIAEISGHGKPVPRNTP